MYQDADGTKLGVPLLEVIEMRRNAKNIVSWIPCSILLCVNAASGQELNVLDREYIPKEWKSTWVSNPDHSGNEYAVVLFRNTFDLPEVSIYPHPLGQIHFNFEKTAAGLAGFVETPEALKRKMVAKGKTIVLRAGKNVIP